MVIKQTDTNPQNFVKRYEYFQYHCEYSDKVSKNHMQQVVNYQNKTFSQPAVFKKKIRQRSESQPKFFWRMMKSMSIVIEAYLCTRGYTWSISFEPYHLRNILHRYRGVVRITV